MTVYIDTSVLLRILLAQPPLLRDWGKWDRAYSSELAGLEARRTIDRLRLDGALGDNGVAAAHQELARLESGIGRIALTRGVLQRAALPMPTNVKTLDAVHLASAMILQERRGQPVVFATHDAQQATAARALGFLSIGL